MGFSKIRRYSRIFKRSSAGREYHEPGFVQFGFVDGISVAEGRHAVICALVEVEFVRGLQL
jgi:hypothetical protein